MKKEMLLVAAGGIGDTVLLAHALPYFLSLAGGEKISLLLRHDAARVAFLFPSEIEIIRINFKDYSKKWLYRFKINRELRRRNFARVISLDYLRHPLLDEKMISACRAKENFAMEPRAWPKYQVQLNKNRSLYTKLFNSGTVLQDKILRLLAFAEFLIGQRIKPSPLKLMANPFVNKEKILVIQPFSAVKEKQFPASFYQKLFAHLPQDFAKVLLGAPNDLEKNPEFKELLELPNVSFDKSGFQEIIPLLQKAALVLSVDTGLMHLAAGVEANTLCIASAAYVGEVVPYASELIPSNLEFIYQPMICQSCLGNCSFPAVDGMYPCLAKLDKAEIIDRIDSMLFIDGK